MTGMTEKQQSHCLADELTPMERFSMWAASVQEHLDSLRLLAADVPQQLTDDGVQ